MTTRTIEPTVITTREEVHWTKSYSNYPATLWQLNYYFRSNLGTGFTAAWATEVTADGSGFDIVVPASKTDDMTVAGDYTWQAWLTEIADSTNKIKIGQGTTRVILGFDPTSVTAVDSRSTAKKMLDAIDTALLAAGFSDTIEYEITTPAGSRRVKRSSREEVLKQRAHWATIVTNEIARERARNGRPLMQSIKIVVKET